MITLSDLRQMRRFVGKLRREHDRAWRKEVFSATNLYRPRLAGKVELCDVLLDEIDREISAVKNPKKGQA